MSAKFSRNNQKSLYDKYFKKTGIQITDEPLGFMSKQLASITEKYHPTNRMSSAQAIKELSALIEQHPEVPTLKNYLQGHYQKVGNKRASEQMMARIIKEHPDYIFGFANQMLNADKSELIKLGHHLGENRTIKEVIKTDRLIHFTEFATYQLAAGLYELAIDEEDAAMTRLQSLIEIDADTVVINNLVEKIVFHQIESMVDTMEKFEKIGTGITARQSVHYPETKKRPIFHHEAINVFYQKEPDDLSPAERQQIINLPRPTLIADLEKVLADSIGRWKSFREEDFSERTHSFLFHALYFLGALAAKESLPKVLDLLRMEEDFIEYWFADYREDVFYPTLYQLSNNQLPLLLEYCKEIYHNSYDRSLISNAVAQIALHEPDRRAEVLEWFTDLIEYLLANPKKEGLIDPIFISFSIGDVLDIRAKELLSLIEKLYKKGWVDDLVQGDWTAIQKEIESPVDAHDLKPLPQNIDEYYDKSYEERRATFDVDSYEASLMTKEDSENAEAEEVVSDLYTQMLMGIDDEPQESIEEYNKEYKRTAEDTIVRTSKKIGRNDPCLCGSGKKYKKCCLNK